MWFMSVWTDGFLSVIDILSRDSENNNTFVSLKTTFIILNQPSGEIPSKSNLNEVFLKLDNFKNSFD